MLKLIKEVAVDFDGTLTHDPFPKCDHLDMKAVEILKKFQSNGGRVVLWTCRYGESLENAVNICKNNGLIFDAVNESTKEQLETWRQVCKKYSYEYGVSPKMYADLYIDDKGAYEIARGGIDWDAIDFLLNPAIPQIA